MDTGMSWRRPLPMGAQVSRFFKPTDKISYGQLFYNVSRDKLDDTKYVEVAVPEGSSIMWEADGLWRSHPGKRPGFEEFRDNYATFVQPATEALPQFDGAEPEDMTFKPVGIITPVKRIHVLPSQPYACKLVDTAVAAHEAQNALEINLVKHSVDGNGRSDLKHALWIQNTAPAYLKWYKEQTGVDYYPHQEPRDRLGEFPRMTNLQAKRFEELRQLSSRIFNGEVELNI